jgi:hypothetical protein
MQDEEDDCTEFPLRPLGYLRMDFADGIHSPQEFFHLLIGKGKRGVLFHFRQFHGFCKIFFDPSRVNAEREKRADELQALAGRQSRILPAFPEPPEIVNAHRADPKRTELLHQLFLDFPVFSYALGFQLPRFAIGNPPLGGIAHAHGLRRAVNFPLVDKPICRFPICEVERPPNAFPVQNPLRPDRARALRAPRGALAIRPMPPIQGQHGKHSST